MRCFITTASLLLLLSSSLIAATIYKWEDAQGVTHFGSEPPANQTAESINRTSSAPKPSQKTAAQVKAEETQTSADIQAEIDREVRKQVAEEEITLRKYCTEVRYNLSQLENNPRVLAEIDGKPTRLSEEERQARIAEMKKIISERCVDVK